MIVRRVVEDEVQHQRDAGFAQIARQQPQIVDRPEPRIDRAVVADRVSAVIVARPDGEQRHQVQVGQAEFLEVADVLPQPAQVLAEQVDVQRTADNLLRLKPIRFVDAMLIQLAELVGTIGPGLRSGRPAPAPGGRRSRNAIRRAETAA